MLAIACSTLCVIVTFFWIVIFFLCRLEVTMEVMTGPMSRKTKPTSDSQAQLLFPCQDLQLSQCQDPTLHPRHLLVQCHLRYLPRAFSLQGIHRRPKSTKVSKGTYLLNCSKLYRKDSTLFLIFFFKKRDTSSKGAFPCLQAYWAYGAGNHIL